MLTFKVRVKEDSLEIYGMADFLAGRLAQRAVPTTGKTSRIPNSGNWHRLPFTCSRSHILNVLEEMNEVEVVE